MNRSFDFAVLQFAAHPMRNERLNIGLVVFLDGSLEVYLPKRLDKLTAISAALDTEVLRESVMGLVNLDHFARSQGSTSLDARVAVLRDLGAAKLSDLGSFVAHSQAAYHEEVARLTRRLVDPEIGEPKNRFKRSKLLSHVKNALRSERILAKKGEHLNEHRVVSNLRIADGLQADLVLKNGAMHVIETVDASSEEVSVRRVISSIGVAAIVLEQARMTFGASDTQSRLIYETSSAVENIAMPSLLAAANQGAELYNWASQQDRQRLVSTLSMLAIPYEEPRNSKTLQVNASSQSRLKLN